MEQVNYLPESIRNFGDVTTKVLYLKVSCQRAAGGKTQIIRFQKHFQSEILKSYQNMFRLVQKRQFFYKIKVKSTWKHKTHQKLTKKT